MNLINQTTMKTKTFFKSALVVLLLGASVSARAEYVKDPTLCNGMTATWDATTRTFTIHNLKPNIQEPYCEWHTDTTWTAGTFDILTSWDGITPGATTYTTGRLKTSWGDPIPEDDVMGNYYLFVAIKSVNNNIPKGTPKAADCGKTFRYLLARSYCDIIPSYCENYNSVSDIITNSITIAPNPATSSETITIKGEYASDAKVSIISTSGSIVGSVIPSVGSDAMTVSLTGLNLQAGIYFIRIESGDKVFSGKLCVK
jgi:hypothetical protein